MASSTKVTVKQGTVIGGTDSLPNGNPYYFFKGIPYAEPPLGKLRFQAPVPLKSFSVPELDCTKEGNVCFQRDRLTGKYFGSEDCLFLNVYTPKMSPDVVLPVMVFIHGGQFIYGSGNSQNYNPLYLMQENVVIVTFNYRLGPLGFLSFPEGNIPGNAALKDQRLVLEWVQENISKFSGDPKNVTLFGNSVGSVCAHLHVLSERSRKLFNKAILQSGLGNCCWAIEHNSSHKTMELAKSFGCTSNDPFVVAEFLQQYEDLEDIFKPLFGPPKLDDIIHGRPVPSRPVIEKDSPEAVFTKAAAESDLMNEKNSIDMPLMIGCTSAEGCVVLPAFIGMLEYLKNGLRYFLPSNGSNLQNTKDLELAIKQFYFKEENIDKTTLNQLCDLLTDFFFMVQAREASEIHSRIQHKSPLYFYLFEFVGELNLHKKKFQMDKIIKGASHGDELDYIFQMAQAPEPWNVREKRMVLSMCKMWANFASFSDPTLGSEWMPVRKIDGAEDFTLHAFVIDDEMRMVENPCRERMEFWINLKNKLASS